MTTVLPIIFLIFSGYMARRYGLLKAGDERVLSVYVYYFALPALFLVDLARTKFSIEVLKFFLACALPVIAITVLFLILAPLLRLGRDMLARLIAASVFGSTAFFGIPFIIFAFPGAEAERLAVMASAFISTPSLLLLVVTLELWRGGFDAKKIGLKLLKNPLLLSILAGLLLAYWQIELPAYISYFLLMLGRTTATVAIFMLGVFMFGREKIDLLAGAAFASLRILLLPLLALVVTSYIGLSGLDRSVVVLMHAMPAALSLIVFSERYRFYPRLAASLIIFSSLAAGLYLNIWLFFLAR